MKERPILFNSPMVRAILDGRKTQTRRVVTQQPADGWAFDAPPQFGRITSAHPNKGRFGAFIRHGVGTDFPQFDLIPSPFGMPGDRLWVRESGIQMYLIAPPNPEKPGLFRHDEPKTSRLGEYWVEETRAPGASYNVSGCSRESALLSLGGAKVVPSIHMPRWACRLELDITGVRVERLQDISDADAQAEGAHLLECEGGGWKFGRGEQEHDTPREAFFALWEQMNGAAAVAANPWVWVIEFQRVEREPVAAAAELCEDDVPF